MADTSEDPVTAIIRYHERTKHRIGQYARSLGFLDWDTQPDPFRTYDGAPRFPLQPDGVIDDSPGFDSVADEGCVEPAPLTRETISRFLFDSLAISAWKRFESSRWSLRCNPSSGNLHPTEAYLVLPAIASLSTNPGTYHYRVADHALELRRPLPDELFHRLFPLLREGAFLVGLSSIHWREAWKYGERAFRYCQHDVGHAIGALAYSASALGWRIRLVNRIGDDAIARILAIEDQTDIEGEVADVLLLVEPADVDLDAPSYFRLDRASLDDAAGRPRLGSRNALSSDHVDWDAITFAHRVTQKVIEPTPGDDERIRPPFLTRVAAGASRSRDVPARVVFRGRRSAVAFDKTTGITKDAFFRFCARCLPRLGAVPFSVFAHEPAIHPIFFVHRVAGLAPGLYALVRTERTRERLEAATRDSFRWEPVDGTPDGLPLWTLDLGDVRNGAAFIACHQEIASDGAFAVAMLADFESALRAHGAWFYRTLHHEAGALGQTMYLEAEALGVRGTGIGCFFDDEMHALLGLRDRNFQTIYHFTVGGPVDDPRIVTE